MSRLLLLSCLCLGLQLRGARAQDDPEAAPDAQLRAAVHAYETGQLEQARALFEQLHAQAPTARTLRGLGVIAFRQGRFIDAVALLEASLRSSQKPLTPELAQGVELVLADARKQIGRVVLVAVDPRAEVQVDGQEPARDLGGALLLAPGAHALVISRPGHAVRRHEIALQAGGQLTLDAGLTAVPATDPASGATASAATGQAPAERRPSARAPGDAKPSPHSGLRRQRLRRASYTLLGVGAGALLTSLAATAAGIKRVRSIESFCQSHECTEDDVNERARAEKLDMLSVLSIGGAALGGASAATGLVVWLTLSRGEAPSTDHPSQRTLLLQFRGSF